MSLLGYPKVIPYTKFEYFGSFVFESCCGQTNKQTEKQINRVSVGNKCDVKLHLFCEYRI